jgi:hypothetical protein
MERKGKRDRGAHPQRWSVPAVHHLGAVDGTPKKTNNPQPERRSAQQTQTPARKYRQVLTAGVLHFVTKLQYFEVLKFCMEMLERGKSEREERKMVWIGFY